MTVAAARVEPLPAVATLRDLFLDWSAQPSDDIVTVFDNGRAGIVELDRGTVIERAAAAAAALASAGVTAGDRVLLLASTEPSFLFGLWGCHLLGAVPVTAPPSDRGGAGRGRLASIAARARPVAVVTGPTTGDVGIALPSIDPLAAAPASELPIADVAPDAPALVQFTSGSTTVPRGAVISHRAMLHNLAATTARFGVLPGETGVSWCPLYHDMGLIGGVIWPLYAGIVNVLVPADNVVKAPLSWLRTLSELAAVITTTPNFALELVCRRLRTASDAYDLGHLRNIIIGGEPVAADTVARFVELLAPSGLDPAAMHAAWGLAETTLLATSRPGGIVAARLDRARMEADGVAVAASGAGDSDAIRIVSLGHPVEGCDVRIVGPNGEALPEDRRGEIEVRTTSCMSGYLDDPEATAAAFAPDGYLRTGDIGIVSGGELYVLGRSKELIITGGRNVLPTDVEAVALTVDDVRSAVAFGVERDGTERVVLLIEARRNESDTVKAVRRAVTAALDLVLTDVVVARRGAIPRTSSGKVMRAAARESYVAERQRELRDALTDSA